MTQAHLAACGRLYRQAVAAFEQLERQLAELQKSVEGLPVQRSLHRRLEDVSADLEQIGQGIALVLELTEDLRQEKRITSILRKQAVRAGLVVRYDLDAD